MRWMYRNKTSALPRLRAWIDFKLFDGWIIGFKSYFIEKSFCVMQSITLLNLKQGVNNPIFSFIIFFYEWLSKGIWKHIKLRKNINSLFFKPDKKQKTFQKVYDHATRFIKISLLIGKSTQIDPLIPAHTWPSTIQNRSIHACMVQCMV